MTQCAHFWGSRLSPSYVQQKTEKQTIKSLSLCQFDVGMQLTYAKWFCCLFLFLCSMKLGKEDLIINLHIFWSCFVQSESVVFNLLSFVCFGSFFRFNFLCVCGRKKGLSGIVASAKHASPNTVLPKIDWKSLELHPRRDAVLKQTLLHVSKNGGCYQNQL